MEIGGVARLISAEIALAIGPAFTPVAEHHDDCAGGNTAMVFLPGKQILDRQAIVGVGGRLSAHVDTHERTDPRADRHLIGGRFAFGEMNRCVHVRATVLGGAKIVRGIKVAARSVLVRDLRQ